MKKYYFTFGVGKELGSRYLVIFAKSETDACRKMMMLHGNEWAFCYNHEQWALSKLEGFFNELKPLEPVYAFSEVA